MFCKYGGRNTGRKPKILLLAALLAAQPLQPGTPASEDYFPPPESQGGWRSIILPNATPTDFQKREILEKTALDWDQLRRAWDYDLQTVGPDSPKSLLIVRHGWIAFERYDSKNGKYNKGTRVRFASGTKSLVGVSLARLFSQNKCKDTDYVYQYLPASWAAGEPARKKIQIRHILSMSSGLEPYDGPYEPANYSDVILNLAVVADPGKLWFYNTGALDLMNYVISNRSGMTMEDFLNSEIMRPIGGSPVYVRPQYKFNGYGFCSFYEITPRDYARIGYLLLKHGRWKQKQIIKEKIATLVTTRPRWLANAALGVSAGGEDKRPPENYAYTFWLNHTGYMPLPADAYMASGGNHKMIVIPSLDMIIVRVGNYIHDYAAVDRTYRMIREGVTDAPPGPDRVSQALTPGIAASGTPPSKSLSIAEFGTVPSGTHLEIEAESGIGVPPVRVDVDPQNPPVKYAWTPNNVPPNYNTPGGPAAVGFAFHLLETGAYNIWIRTIAPDSHSDSYFLVMDGSVIERPWHTLVIPQSKEWRWIKIRDSRTIKAGNHVLEFRNRESGIKLDKMIITSDRSFVP